MKNSTILAILLLLFSSEMVWAQNAKKVVVLEQFTNSLCPACGYRNPELYETILQKYDTEIVHIAYHNNRPLPPDPFHQANPLPTLIRTDYYEVIASPTIVVNGVKLRADKPLLSVEQLEKQLNQSSPLHIKIEETLQADKERKLQIITKTTSTLPNAPYKLYVTVVEKNVFFCTYFEYAFDNVFRTFLSNNLGDEISLSNTEKNYSYQYFPKADWNEEQLFVVAFVQNIESKEIINAAFTQPLSSHKTSRYADKEFSLLSTVADDVCGKNEGAIEIDICVDTAPIEVPTDLEFEWSNGASTQYIYNLTAGRYSVKITNKALETSTIQQYEIQGNQKIQATITTQADTGFTDGKISVQANGGTGELTIDWSNGATTFSLEALHAGTYSYIISDENGCTYQQTEAVKCERLLNIGEAIVTVQAISCFGKNDASVNISTNGEVPIQQVVWFLEDQTGEELTDLSAGNYTFITLDETKKQLHEGTFVIAAPEPINWQSKQANGFETGYIRLENVSGGSPPYQYDWSNGFTTPQIDQLTPGEYSVEISDQNGCLKSQLFTLVQNATTVQHISCFDAGDGAIEIEVNDGLDYTFNWTNGTNQATQNNLSAGRYGLTVSQEDFTKFLSFDIEEPQPLVVSLMYNDENATIRPQVRGGTPPYQFLWNTLAKTPLIENPENGMYTITLTDANACSKQASIEINTITGLLYSSVKPVKIYPNPVSTVAYLDVPSSYQKQPIQLLNVQGAKQILPFSIVKHQIQFDFSALPSAVYFLQLFDEMGQVEYVAKVLVCR